MFISLAKNNIYHKNILQAKQRKKKIAVIKNNHIYQQTNTDSSIHIHTYM